MIDDSAIAAGILRLTTACGPGASISPDEVAQALAAEALAAQAQTAEWRPLLGRVRGVAARLATDGRIDILRKGKPIAPAELRGVVRLRLRGPGG